MFAVVDIFWVVCTDVCDPTGSHTGEAYDVYHVRVYCTANMYRLNQKLKFLY